MAKDPVYRVVFINNGKTYEVYATSVDQGYLYGFVQIEGLLFNERTSLVVDPGEEKLKAEFDGVGRTNIPMHSIIRIDEVEKQGTPKIGDAKGEVVTAFPIPKPDKSSS
ncbi:DUF1820 family protein [Aliikangiella marina]|uniref:DUF1820 family protein n=1 Tax=Aliikangiella marina TaxID=1712262 RepID=A0A545T302_9GAMM|nr:DUF1820 family protein [Aliikangiella marina]TQV71565.1 DUF1820 family protein [Aliikangiella marina]